MELNSIPTSILGIGLGIGIKTDLFKASVTSIMNRCDTIDVALA